MGRAYGYSRVSTSEKDWAIQLDALASAGVDDRDVFREKVTGTKRDRAELRRMLDLLRPGDQATVYRLDRLARSQLHLLQIIEEIEAKGAKLVSVMDKIDTSTATGKMVVGLLCVLAEFERNLLVERSAAGRKLARARGVNFGRKPKLTPAMIRQVLSAHDDPSTTVPETCRVLGVSKSSYYIAPASTALGTPGWRQRSVRTGLDGVGCRGGRVTLERRQGPL
ncbi:recombinase family protein [Alsobacter sp. SYSU BS001988]